MRNGQKSAFSGDFRGRAVQSRPKTGATSFERNYFYSEGVARFSDRLVHMMTLSTQQASTLQSLQLNHPPVAVAFLSSPPEGLDALPRPDAASCGYWRQASEGRAFYTTAGD